MHISSQLPNFNSTKLLEWYKSQGRKLPWREKEGAYPSPYRVWLSEIMLQQTVAKTVVPYFNNFIAKWPDIESLSRASLDEIFQEWAGLGYYRRAENLLKAAKVLSSFKKFPNDRKSILSLPGVGEYTASAIQAIAFNMPIVPVDGNLERITSRFFCLDNPLPENKKKIDLYAQKLNSNIDAQKDSSDFTQALFDLGATICTPKNPKCPVCPVQDNCLARQNGVAEKLPNKTPKKRQKELYASFFILFQSNSLHGYKVLLKKRNEGELLANTFMPPSSNWSDQELTFDSSMQQAFSTEERSLLSELNWRQSAPVKHVFTHIKLYASVYYAQLSSDEIKSLSVNSIFSNSSEKALSTLAKKLIKSASSVAKYN